jgi:hypothetical protein
MVTSLMMMIFNSIEAATRNSFFPSNASHGRSYRYCLPGAITDRLDVLKTLYDSVEMLEAVGGSETGSIVKPQSPHDPSQGTEE